MLVMHVAKHIIESLPGRQHELPPELLPAKRAIRIPGQLGARDLFPGHARQALETTLELPAAERAAPFRVAVRHDADADVGLLRDSLPYRLFEVVAHVRDQQNQLGDDIGHLASQ